MHRLATGDGDRLIPVEHAHDDRSPRALAIFA
jgi:hypothetical protein